MPTKDYSLKSGTITGVVAAAFLSFVVVVFMATSWAIFVVLWAGFIGWAAMTIGGIATSRKNWGVVAAASGFLVPCLLTFALFLSHARDSSQRPSACDQDASQAADDEAPNFAFQRKPLRGSAELRG